MRNDRTVTSYILVSHLALSPSPRSHVLDSAKKKKTKTFRACEGLVELAMDPSELLFGPPDLLAEGHRLNHAGDETNYANKDAAARDFEDELSGSEVESEEEAAGAVPEAAASEASRMGQDETSGGATGGETRWARAVAVVKGEAEGPEAFFRNGDVEVVPRWSRVFARGEEETEVAGEDAYLEADLQRAREMEERRHGVAHGETVLAIAEEPRVRPGQLEAEVRAA
jgi:hypothetical protein